MTTEAQPISVNNVPVERMFTATIEAGVMKSYLDSIKVLSDEVLLQITDDGWHTVKTDPAHVALVVADLSKEAFLTYHHEGLDSLMLDIDIAKKLFGAVKGSMTEVKLTIRPRANNGKNPATSIELEWEIKGDTYKATHNLNEMTPSEHHAKIPNLDLPVTFTMNRSQLEDLYVVISKVAMDESIKVCYEDGHISFQEKGDRGKIVQHVHVENLKAVNCDKCESVFPNHYWNDLLKGLKPVDKVFIKIGQEYPVVMEGEKDGIRLQFMIAPRIMSN